MTQETQVEGSKKPKKAAKKEKDPNKVFAEKVVDVFLRPTRRRMGFIYPALCRIKEGIIVLGTNPKHIVFGNPEEGMALVHIKDSAFLAQFWNWLLSQGASDQLIEAIDLGKLLAGLAREKYDLTKQIAHRNPETGDLWVLGSDKQAANAAIYSLFTMMRYDYQVSEYIRALLNNQTGFDYPVETIKDVPKLQRFVIPHALFQHTSLGDVYSTDIRLMASRGYDLLCASQFPLESIQFHGFRFWHVAGKTIYYASIIDTSEFTFLAARCNVFLIPV